MMPLMLEGPDVLIILAVVVLLFGGAKLAGLGKSAGRALREFKEETRGLSHADESTQLDPAGHADTAGPRRVHDVGLARPTATPAASPSAAVPPPSTPSATPSPTTPSATASHPAGQSHG